MPPAKPWTRERFLANFIVRVDWESVDDPFYNPKGCWLWTGKQRSGTNKEYGGMNWRNNQIEAHRLSYIFFNDCELTRKLDVHHECRVKLCVNPDHLLASTRKEHYRLEHDGKCAKGHELTIENTNKRGACVICGRERSRRRYHENKTRRKRR